MWEPQSGKEIKSVFQWKCETVFADKIGIQMCVSLNWLFFTKSAFEFIFGNDGLLRWMEKSVVGRNITFGKFQSLKIQMILYFL